MASNYPALMIKQPESPVQQIGQVMQIKSAVQQQQAQQQEQQLRQNQIQSAQLDLQMKQMSVKNMQTTQAALSDPKIWDDFNKWKGTSQGSDMTVSDPTSQTGSPIALHPIAKYLMDAKGLPLMGPGGAMELSQQFDKNEEVVATLLKTKGEAAEKQLDIYNKKVGNLVDKATPIFSETDPEKQMQALKNLKIDAQSNPIAYPTEFLNKLPSIKTPADLAPIVNSGKLLQSVVEEGTKKAQEQTAQAEASQKTRLAAGISSPQLNDIKNTVNTYQAIPAPMRAAFTKELDNAPDLETVQKIQTRADAAQESFQRSADARQNALAMRDVGVGQAMAGELVKQDQSLAGALNQTAGIRGLLDMSKGGNETAASAAQVRFAAHEIVEGGVKRMNQTELDALTKSLGTYGRQFQAWYDKGFDPKQMPKTTNAEMQKILDAEDAIAHNAHNQSVGFIQNRFSQISGGGIKAPAAGATHRYNPDTGQIEAIPNAR